MTLIEGSYEQTIDKYLQAGQANRPDLVQMPEYMVQQMVDTQSVVPAEACIEVEWLRHQRVPADRARCLRDAGRAVVDAVQHLQPGAVLQQEDVRRRRPRSRQAAGLARRLARRQRGDRQVRRGEVRPGARLRLRLRRRLVHRAVVRQGRRVLRRQPERAHARAPRKVLYNNADRAVAAHLHAVDGQRRAGGQRRRQRRAGSTTC